MNTNYTNIRLARMYERVINYLPNSAAAIRSLHSIENYPSKITSKNMETVKKDLKLGKQSGFILEQICEGITPHDVIALLKNKNHQPSRRPRLQALILRTNGGFA